MLLQKYKIYDIKHIIKFELVKFNYELCTRIHELMEIKIEVASKNQYTYLLYIGFADSYPNKGRIRIQYVT